MIIICDIRPNPERQKVAPLMNVVVAVMLIVVCRPDLLHCAPAETWGNAWRSVESCDSYRSEIASRFKARAEDDSVVLTKCRLFLDEDHIFQGDRLVADRIPGDIAMF